MEESLACLLEEVLLRWCQMILGIACATMTEPSIKHYPGDLDSWFDHMTPRGKGSVASSIQYNRTDLNLGVVGSYQKLYGKLGACDLIMFIHDDVICREDGWDERVKREFREVHTMGVLGFGGARWHGTTEIYKRPYGVTQLQRGEYLSNVDDAEVHGARFTGEADVAVLDGFCIVVRRSFLDQCGGLHFVDPSASFFCYDYAICAMARRLGYRIRMVGIRCHHRGGGTSVSASNEITSQEAYNSSHRWFYDEFKDVMPARVK
jgi:GT2 family glycosyltransferase